MSHRRFKTKYNTEGAYGQIETHIMYVDHNITTDTVTFYDEDGDIILTVQDTVDNNILHAINRLYSPSEEGDITGRICKNSVERLTSEELKRIGI